MPGTDGYNVQEIEISDDYLFVSYSTSDSAFIRMDIANGYEKSLMEKTPGDPFTMYGWKKFASINEHIIYTDQNVFWTSHDYGDTWDYTGIPGETGMYMYATDSLFFIGGSRKLHRSNNLGYTFDQIYYESFFISTIPHPFLYKYGQVYFSEERGLMTIDPDGVDETVLDNTPDPYYSMTSAGDTLIASSPNAVHMSLDSGANFSTVAQFPLNFIIEVVHYEGMIFATVSQQGMQVSFDHGDNFYPINEGIAPGTYVRRVKFHDQNMYIATSIGVFKRPVSEIHYRTLTGTVFHDIDQNGVQDPSEPGLSQQVLKLANHNYISLTDSAGLYEIGYAGIPDTLRYVGPQPHYLPDPTFFQSTYFIDTVDFAIAIDSNTISTEVYVTPYSDPVPGFPSIFGINYRNHGSGHVNTTLKLGLDPVLTLDSASNLNYSLLNDTMSWALTLTPFSAGTITVACTVPPDVNLLGDTLTLSADIGSYSLDVLPEDNRDTLHQVIVGSYDPNDKGVSPADDVSTDFIQNREWLDYLVRFQNTGTALAWNVVVDDSLHHDVVPASFQMIGHSHDCSVSIDTSNVLSFRFENIQLPDSASDEANSHGFVRYRIKPSVEMQLNDSISNTAYIYFDFNPPIVTNTTVNHYRELATVVPGITTGNQAGQRAFPNPNNGTFLVKSGNITNLQVFDGLGRMVAFETHNPSGQTEIRIEGPLNGFYVLRYKTEEGLHRFEKVLITID